MIRSREGPEQKVRLPNLSQVVLLGNVQVSTQVVQTLCEREIPLIYASRNGWFYGMARGFDHKHIELRIRQHRLIEAGAALPIARAIVSGKIQNQRTLLRRNLEERDSRLLGRLALYARQARHTEAAESLLGVEGIAGQLYFGAFPRLFRGAGAWAGEVFAAEGRNRRPPRDEVNAVLSFLYSMLTKECHLAAHAVGFEPYRGFYHSPKYGRPALALDLCKESARSSPTRSVSPCSTRGSWGGAILSGARGGWRSPRRGGAPCWRGSSAG